MMSFTFMRHLVCDIVDLKIKSEIGGKKTETVSLNY